MHGINDPSGYVPHQPPPEKAGEGNNKHVDLSLSECGLKPNLFDRHNCS